LSSFPLRPRSRVIFPTVLLLITAIAAVAQSSQTSSTTQPANNPTLPAPVQSPGPNGNPSASAPTQVAPQTAVVAVSTTAQVAPAEETPQPNPALRRIERARALAAAHQLQQAATDLENVRVSVNDVALRNVTSLMLIGIYLEEGNYVRAQALLEESFQARSAQKDESLRTYFAMAGQTINGVRSHLARYRTFGFNPSETGLPAEANTDLERVRGLLERVAAQAKEISSQAGRSYDAVALQEDVVGIRLSLPRDDADREKWESEYLAVREKLAASQAVTSIGRSALLDAVTSRVPNPFASKPSSDTSSGTSATNPARPAASAPTSTTTTTDTREPQLISTGSLSGKETKRVTPAYPTTARNAGVAGTVRVYAIIDENGKVWVTNSDGPSLLRKAAEDAAKGWTFPPTLVSGRPVRVAGYLDFDFKL
jgi:TonB family protein